MKKVIFILILILALAIGVFFIFKNNKKTEEPANTTPSQTTENTVEEENKVSNEVENEITNEVENKVEEKETDSKENDTKPSAAPVATDEENVFLTDFDNYNPSSNLEMISQEKAKKIAQIGFEESKKRIAGEGADDVDSEKVQLEDISPNNYFTRKGTEYDKTYTNIKRKAYVFTRTNDMGNGIKIYVDAYTGLIIGGDAFGD